MWECDWERLKKEDPAVKAFVKDMQRPCDGQFKMTEKTILRAVTEDRMFGALEVDQEAPVPGFSGTVFPSSGLSLPSLVCRGSDDNHVHTNNIPGIRIRCLSP
jgi:hypothetical protein